jgi:hypothetical protein
MRRVRAVSRSLVTRPDLVPRLGVAIALVGASIVTFGAPVGWVFLAALAIWIVPDARRWSFVGSIGAYAMVWLSFNFFRSLADETLQARVLTTYVARAERWLFGGQLPSITLQEFWFDPAALRLHDYGLTSIHWSFVVVPHLVAVFLWWKHPARFRAYVSGLTVMLAMGLAIYFLIPSSPPWLAPDAVNSPAAAQVVRVIEPVGKAIGGRLYAAVYDLIGESNPIAAMPSIHMATTFLLVFAMGGLGRRWRGVTIAYAAFMGFALIYLGEHYVIDVGIGMFVASYGWLTATLWMDRIAPIWRQRASNHGLAGLVIWGEPEVTGNRLNRLARQ